MRKEDNDWKIEEEAGGLDYWISITINGTKYQTKDKTAVLAHAILLLVDAVNDKN